MKKFFKNWSIYEKVIVILIVFVLILTNILTFISQQNAKVDISLENNDSKQDVSQNQSNNSVKQFEDFTPYYNQTLKYSSCEQFINKTNQIDTRNTNDWSEYTCVKIKAPLNWNEAVFEKIADDYTLEKNPYDSATQASIDLMIAINRPFTQTPANNDQTNTVDSSSNNTNNTAKKLLFTNPGGPGSSGINMIPQFTNDFSKVLLNNYDIVSWDPRGVNMSTPIQCYENDSEKLVNIYESVPGELPDNINYYYADSAKRSDVCKKNSGSLLKFVNTISTVRDLELIRVLLSKNSQNADNITFSNDSPNTAKSDQLSQNAQILNNKMNYFGFSYGTEIGEVYASIFADVSDKIVLDGVMDTNLSLFETSNAQKTSFRKVFDAFVDNCISGKIKNCIWKGEDKNYVESWINSKMKVLQNSPQKINSKTIPNRPFNENVFLFSILTSLYNKDYWEILNSGLNMLENNNDNTILTLIADSYFDYSDDLFENNSVDANLMINCSNFIEKFDLDEYNKQISNVPHDFMFDLFLSPSMTCDNITKQELPTNLNINYTELKNYQDKNNLSIKQNVHLSNEVLDFENAAPILFISNNNDPATPYINAQNMFKRFKNSYLLTHEGDQHIAYFMKDNTLIESVDHYFIDGTIPLNAEKH